MTRPQTMAAAFESVRTAYTNALNNDNNEWAIRWRDRFERLVELIPSGFGIDRYPHGFASVEVTPSAIRFDVGYHHMNDGGYYDGWTDHTIVVRPAFDGISVSVSGRNRRDVKDHLHEVMEYAFTRHVSWDQSAQRWIVESDEDRYSAMERAYPAQKDHRGHKSACGTVVCRAQKGE